MGSRARSRGQPIYSSLILAKTRRDATRRDATRRDATLLLTRIKDRTNSKEAGQRAEADTSIR